MRKWPCGGAARSTRSCGLASAAADFQLAGQTISLRIRGFRTAGGGGGGCCAAAAGSAMGGATYTAGATGGAGTAGATGGAGTAGATGAAGTAGATGCATVGATGCNTGAAGTYTGAGVIAVSMGVSLSLIPLSESSSGDA